MTQKIIQGINSIGRMHEEIKAAGYDGVFLVTGKHFPKAAIADLFPGIRVFHVIKEDVNVEENEIDRTFALFEKNSTRALVAIGGGSVIDLVKSMRWRWIGSSSPLPFFIAAPTTAGSGSEATSFAVVYKENKKYSLAHPALLPDTVILDPQLTYSLSPYQTAISGMDVLAQAVESYWNNNAIAASKELASESIRLWKEFFAKATNDPGTEAREKMLLAAHLAGKAINITRTTGPHALSYYLTAQHNVPHGQAVALFLPLFFLYNNAGTELCKLLGVINAIEAKESIEEAMKQAGLATRLSGLNIDKIAIIEDLLRDVNEERFANNPVAFNRERLKQLILEYL